MSLVVIHERVALRACHGELVCLKAAARLFQLSFVARTRFV
jgi:hypothetical protein